jgi:hypothetical protein
MSRNVTSRKPQRLRQVAQDMSLYRVIATGSSSNHKQNRSQVDTFSCADDPMLMLDNIETASAQVDLALYAYQSFVQVLKSPARRISY